MLSTHAFNALLKTLEEPPKHVKFVLATTENRKVPATIISRCQRFNLRRIDAGTLAKHLNFVASNENVEITEDATLSLARAADGSARDALSLLDQAIAFSADVVDQPTVRKMLGFADTNAIAGLAQAVFSGDTTTALQIVGDQYSEGGDPITIIGDLLELVHWMSRYKAAPEAEGANSNEFAEWEIVRSMAKSLTMADLTQTWQILLRGQNEVRMSSVPLKAMEMVLIRLIYAARLPSPVDLIRQATNVRQDSGQLNDKMPSSRSNESQASASYPTGFKQHAAISSPDGNVGKIQSGTEFQGGANTGMSSLAPLPGPQTEQPEHQSTTNPTIDPAVSNPQTFEAVIALAEHHRQAILYGHLLHHVHLVSFKLGHIEVRLSDAAPRELAPDLARFLTENTGQAWLVSVSPEPGDATIHDQESAREKQRYQTIREHPLVEQVFQLFPNASIEAIRQTSNADEIDLSIKSEVEDV
jgi:DNA polymerase-3 subunit gamma/tau